MTTRNLLVCLLLAGLVGTVGCARAARDTTGFAVSNSAVVSAPFMDTWLATREVLQEEGYDIHTRDRRGRFVAYSDMKRHLLVPHRQQYTITLDEEGTGSTRVTVQTLRQVYGVTLMTYPGWHDRKTTDDKNAQAILDGVQAYIANGGKPAPEEEPAAEPAENKA